MRITLIALTAGASLLASPVLARAPDKPEEPKTEAPDKPITEQTVTATDVAATPLDDLNLRKQDLPPQLIAAQARPYDLTGLRRCPQIAAAIGELDAVLGDDLDLPHEDKRDISPGRVGREVVRVFIPFNGLIREISGANGRDRELQTAIYAGGARRAFLKGYGEARGCRYPARSATARAVASRTVVAPPPREARRDDRRERDDGGEVTFVARPVVQKTD